MLNQLRIGDDKIDNLNLKSSCFSFSNLNVGNETNSYADFQQSKKCVLKYQKVNQEKLAF